MKTEKDLEKFVRDNNIPAAVMKEVGESRSSSAAADTLKVGVERIAKTICLVADDEFVSVILPGDKRIDLEKLKTLLRKNRIRLAHDDEIIEHTGFEKGGVPPISYKSKFIVDSSLDPNEEVFCGGGSKESVLRIKAKDIITIDNPLISDVLEEV